MVSPVTPVLSCLLLAVRMSPSFIKHQLHASILQPSILEEAGANQSSSVTSGYDLWILNNYFLSPWFVPQ